MVTKANDVSVGPVDHLESMSSYRHTNGAFLLVVSHAQLNENGSDIQMEQAEEGLDDYDA